MHYVLIVFLQKILFQPLSSPPGKVFALLVCSEFSCDTDSFLVLFARIFQILANKQSFVKSGGLTIFVCSGVLSFLPSVETEISYRLPDVG